MIFKIKKIVKGDMAFPDPHVPSPYKATTTHINHAANITMSYTESNNMPLSQVTPNRTKFGQFYKTKMLFPIDFLTLSQNLYHYACVS